MLRFFRNLYRYCYYRLIIPILRDKKKPEFIAGGVAVGLFSAFTPIVFQMYIVLLIWFIAKLFNFKFSLPVALALTWVSNGVTNLPLFFTYYVLGCLVLRIPIMMDYHSFISSFHEGILSGVKHLIGEFGKPIVVGSFIVMMVSSTLGFFITRRFIIRRRKQIDAKRAARAAAILAAEIHQQHKDDLPIKH